MGLSSNAGARLLLLLAWAPFAAIGQTNPLAIVPSDRILAQIDNQVTLTLPGNIHPMARPQNDAGPVPPSYPMPHLVLVLKRDAAQQAALDALSAAQQNRQSPLYHHWLGPDEFGAHFGVSQHDLDRIANWLVSEGFTIDDIPTEHGTIKFSGTAAQVEAAFHTPIHFYRVADGLHFANSADQQIPQALAAVVVGVAALHNFQPRPLARMRPLYLFNGQHYMEPSDFATIYNLNPLYAKSIVGTGAGIAITAPCSIDLSLVFTYWDDYVSGRTAGLYYDYYGTVPACDSDGSFEAYLDLEWSGAVAKNSNITLVASEQGVYDAAYNAVHNKIAPVISTSYGACEANYGTAGDSLWNSLWQTAASYGITALISSGDAGVDGCDDPHTILTATPGNSPGINAFCSSQSSLCVGGNQFNDTANPGQYWSASGSALQYIPEMAWNESSLEPDGAGLWSSGGGYSILSGNTRPSWQTGNNSAQRGVPDVALSAAGHVAYVICSNNPCGPNSGYIWYADGTSAASPSFAGIIALLVQSTGEWQGNVGPTLYELAGNTSLKVFHDVTSGNNSVPGMRGYSAGPGWDPVTGLGSVDANALISNWPGSNPTTPAVTLSTGQLSFGNQILGTAGAAQIVTVRNSGSGGLNIGQLTLTGGNTGDFPATSTCSNTTLAAGATCIVTVTFNPAATGSRTAAVSIPDNASNSPQTVALTGTGVSAAPTVGFYNQEVSKMAPPASGCATPPAATTFETTDGTVYLFFDASVTGSDNLTSDWLAPNGDVLTAGSWGSLAGGSYCFTGVSLDIGNPKPGHLGAWQARVYDNATQLFAVPFTVTASTGPSGLQLVTVAPCRVMDTRLANGPLGGPSMGAGTSRTIPIPSSSCGVPANAMAYSLNFTVVPGAGRLGSLTVWPTGTAQPLVSTLTSPGGSVIASAAIVPAGTGGAINAYVTDETDLVVDINGYFVPPAAGSLQFYPLQPCRVLDTRSPDSAFGGPTIAGGTSRSFPVVSSGCGAPAGAAAYSLNVTVVPEGYLGYLTAWPTGQAQPYVSTMNAWDGTVIANAAIVPAGTGGAVSFFASDTTDVVVDINGYFAPPGTNGLNFYTVTPCRLVDTRNPNGPLGGPAIPANSTRSFSLPQASCGLPATPAAQAYSLAITAFPPGVLPYLTMWPEGVTQPVVSTLNAWKGQAVANAALVPAGAGGAISVFVTNVATNVTIDTAGYFGP